MENKNTLIALTLMLVVWIAFSFIFPSRTPVPENNPSVVEKSSGDEKVQTPSAAESVVDQPVSQISPVAATVIDEVREITVENDFFTAVFSSSGASLKSFVLKQFKQTKEADSGLVSLVSAGPERTTTLRLEGTENFRVSGQNNYTVDIPGASLTLAPGESRSLTFSFTDVNGLELKKIFTFNGDGYDFSLQVNARNRGLQVLRGNLVLNLVEPWDDSRKGGSGSFTGPVSLVGDKIKTEDVDDLAKEAKIYGSDLIFSGFETTYFLSALIPQGDAVEKVQIAKRGDVLENQFNTPYTSLNPGDEVNFGFLAYYGPRDIDILNTVDPRLSQAVDFGFFGLIARPLTQVLKFFYTYVGNYGVAIILLTVIIKLLFWPLTQKSYQSMKSMQKLQPEMAKIREKFKNDKERLNREIMTLYKEKKVNPLGGCLPMVIQIPVFFALYKVLLHNIDLRHAPFFLWITDLSVKDPFYITPLIMGATMFIQQKMTPTSMDPKQAKLFMLMPVVFTFMFLNFPAGLVLYWLVNNLLTILQQYRINRPA
ncbi:protein translocase subunit YidC [Desulfuromonas soudanensis]|uniref:Membrane protein insertase YidC n=1 Tax=Desulfuromonas soudanensis TaxID=1603606 RepID=A0A0M4DCM3_9BACT|nr:membrane protein insertase YidC [Desulfuromonas soudanensis]ALC18305.1 protein translocase subunit YidC [Desulfuromonas soudanensis]